MDLSQADILGLWGVIGIAVPLAYLLLWWYVIFPIWAWLEGLDRDD